MNLDDQIKEADEDSNRDLKRVVFELRARAQWLAENLQRLVATLDKDGIEANINTLGEVQGLGDDVNRLCIKFGEAREARSAKRNMLRHIESMEFVAWRQEINQAELYTSEAEPTLLLKVSEDTVHGCWEVGFVDILTMRGYVAASTHLSRETALEEARARGFVERADLPNVRPDMFSSPEPVKKQPKSRR